MILGGMGGRERGEVWECEVMCMCVCTCVDTREGGIERDMQCIIKLDCVLL